jgi:hypothetical protein
MSTMIRSGIRPARRRCDRETIDSELRLLAAVRRSIREHGGEPPSRYVDKLLDERNLLARSFDRT